MVFIVSLYLNEFNGLLVTDYKILLLDFLIGCKLKILYIVNEPWFFLSHRLPIALAAKEKGYTEVGS